MWGGITRWIRQSGKSFQSEAARSLHSDSIFTISYELVQKAARAHLPIMVASQDRRLAAEMGQALNDARCSDKED